jgi:hypothetical protein
MAKDLGKNRPDMIRMEHRNVCALPRSDDAEGHSILERAPGAEAAGSCSEKLRP